jgi:hypothetical protein
MIIKNRLKEKKNKRHVSHDSVFFIAVSSLFCLIELILSFLSKRKITKK